MTEQEWLQAIHPRPMLDFVRGKASDRKLRLFAAACCRRIWHLLPNEPSRRLVEVIERYADGLATEADLGAAEGDFHLAAWDRTSGHSLSAYAFATEAVEQAARDRSASDHGWQAAAGAADQAASAAAASSVNAAGRIFGRADEHAVQAALFRDIFGTSPFRPSPSIPPPLLQWNDGIVRQLAEQSYEQRLLPSGHLDPERLAVLADALEEVGAEAELVGHLRGPGPHTRGCWAVDLVLGKS